MNISKIIKASVGGRSFIKTAHIGQEDYGIIFKIIDENLPPTYYIDFSNDRENGTSIPVLADENGAEIPEELISTGKDVYAFLYYVGDGYGKNLRVFQIPNERRPERGDITPTPAQQPIVDQLISKANEAITTAEQKAGEAGESARSASDDADRAERARTGAETAQGKAEEAQESAGRAKDDAETSERNASESERKAKGYAETASEKADSIHSMTASAQTLPAGSSASASYNAETGVMSFGIPKGDKGEKGDRGEQGIQGIQGERGLTGEKGDKGDKGDTGAQGIQGIQGEKGEQGIQGEKGEKGDKGDKGDAGEVTLADLNSALIDKAPIITDTASGAIASFTDGADDLPLKSLIVDINPIQDLSQGDPSPENICPISGWTSVDVEQRGKNLLSPNFNDYSQTNAYSYILNVVPKNSSARFTFTDKDTSIDVSGCNIGFVGETPLSNVSVTNYRWVVNNGVIQSNVSNLSSRGVLCGNVFIYPNTKDVFDRLFARWNIMVELGSTATPYSPYTGRSLTINLGQTVYGGHIDVLSGVLTVDRAMVTFDGTESGWQWYENYKQAYISDALSNAPAKLEGSVTYTCNVFKPVSYWYRNTNIGNYSCPISNGNGIAFSHNVSTLDEFKAFAQANPIQFCYELATPIEIQLSANQVNSLLGVNNIWADSGDTEVEYRADTKLFIERLTAPDSADMVADANITSGQYFMVGNSLYKATANIANGSAIIVGTNCIRKSLSEALNEINA